MRSMIVSGAEIRSWGNIQVWYRQVGGSLQRINDWDWSTTPHIHYEIYEVIDRGSWWVPASQHPPRSWANPVVIEGTRPLGSNPVNRNGAEHRPANIYFWIPRESMPFEVKTNNVVCNYPTSAPPSNTLSKQEPNMKDVHALLSDVLAPTPTNAFQDSDGLISFVNLSTSFVQDSREFIVGQRVCDKISNFFSTLRIKVFASMQSGKIKPLSGDQKPTTQWDPAVTHYIQYLLAQAGGLTNFHIVTETYSYTQVMSEFSTAFVKLLFDAAVVPELVITDITNFLQGVGDSLRASWDNRSRTYQTILLAQCHEAVPEDASGKDFRYFPKIKYYYININSSQTEFSTPCSRTESITFNFTYEYYVTGLAADVLDEDTKLYDQFVTNFLDLAQATNYKDAKNNLNSILDGTTSGGSGLGTDDRAGDTNVYGVAFSEYPLVKVGRESANTRLEDLLNQR